MEQLRYGVSLAVEESCTGSVCSLGAGLLLWSARHCVCLSCRNFLLFKLVVCCSGDHGRQRGRTYRTTFLQELSLHRSILLKCPYVGSICA